jgi:alpha-glucuronidase
MHKSKFIFLLLIPLVVPFDLHSELGKNLWLRYPPVSDQAKVAYSDFSKIYVPGNSSVLQAAKDELQKAFKGMTGMNTVSVKRIDEGTILLGTNLKGKIGVRGIDSLLQRCGKEGYILKTLKGKRGRQIVITGNSDAGVLYGTFALLRLMQTEQSIDSLNIVEASMYDLRLLNHWDNLDGTVERGYAGHSIWWNREEDLEDLKEEYRIYARANASVGINGAVLNNVNANPKVLTSDYIHRFAEFANLLRPYNIKVYMSVNFSSPSILGGLKNSDPMRQEVREWWKKKVEEIYAEIPDFGGFLVKANSEGQPGPQNFGQTHADGANMLAEALDPYGGVVMWRAFVYSPSGDDRAKQAYHEFVPLDGKFKDNVIVQAKNGPIDFQPREPFSPIFGAMPKTSLMVEFQITKEYLGFSDHLAYLAPLQKECLESDTYCQGSGSTVAKVTDGSLFGQNYTAIAGVANIGRDINWTGHPFDQANWYAFGRLAWNHELRSEDIACEWIEMTFSKDTEFIQPVVNIMMRSREAVVDYMTSLGLHHLMGWGHHYGPEPWCEVEGARPDWLPKYYHKAAKDGIGFDRSETGSNAVEQYHEPLRSLYNNPQTCPENLILWFHHLPWNYTMSSGLTLWDELCYHYYHGVDEVRLMQSKWGRLKGMIDDGRFEYVQHKLRIQVREAEWWRDACVLYFQTFSGMSVPPELERSVHNLRELKQLKFDMTHHN